MMAVMSAMFPDKLAREHPDCLIEIGFTDGDRQSIIERRPDVWHFDMVGAAAFAISKNLEGRSFYVSMALRKPGTNTLKRAGKADVEGSDKIWIDCDTDAQVTALKLFCSARKSRRWSQPSRELCRKGGLRPFSAR